MAETGSLSSDVDSERDSVDVSNACREFYQARRKVAATVKEKLAASGRQQKTKATPIDDAISKLRTEMASLMEKDLSLMKQLLNLNETIEDLKWQKRNSYVQTPRDSSYDLEESDWSVSETDMYESESDVEIRTHKRASTSFHVNTREFTKTETITGIYKNIDKEETGSGESVSYRNKNENKMLRPSSTSSHRLSISLETRKFLDLPSELDEFLNGPSSLSDEENSSDSGINESDLWPEMHATV